MSNFKLIELTVGMVMTNCYIGYNDDTREAFIVDPGDDAKRISLRRKSTAGSGRRKPTLPRIR